MDSGAAANVRGKLGKSEARRLGFGKTLEHQKMAAAEIQRNCRSCGAVLPAVVLDLGKQPLANSLLDSIQSASQEARFPLDVKVCSQCGLMQLGHTVPPNALFSDYLYFSSVSDALLSHAKAASEGHVADYELSEKSFVVEIASNDGYLLRNFVRMGIPCLGVEPAQNIAKVAVERGIPTHADFFSAKLAQQLVSERGSADLVLGNNVFAHVPDTNDFVKGLSILLAPSGHAVLEFPWAHAMVEHLEFDTIYHEHFFYFHAQALVPLLARHGLEMVRIEKIPIHGGSLRVHIGREGADVPEASVADVLDEEAKAGVGGADYSCAFADRVRHLKNELVEELGLLKSSGKRIAAYGASAKGSTLLNYCGIGRELLEFVVDRSPHKQGKLTPGTHIPILPSSALQEHMPDVTLLLTWNFAEEIAAQQEAYLAKGGRFLVPVPYPHYLSS